MHTFINPLFLKPLSWHLVCIRPSQKGDLMHRQLQIISQFKQAYHHPTLQRAAELTGINVTRVHRIFKGAPMKLSEWECFSQAIFCRQKTPEDQLKKAFEQCLMNLGPSGKSQLLAKLQRLQQLTKLANPSETWRPL